MPLVNVDCFTDCPGSWWQRGSRTANIAAHEIFTVVGGWMRPVAGCLLLIGFALLCQQAHAQIYTCTAPDGSRVFSDEKCGPDAKIVKGIDTRKRPAKTQSAPVPPKSPAELEKLLAACNSGEESACMTWTKGGGPNQLRAKERELAATCESGSLAACEERYCRDGATDECRRRVMDLATVSGGTWYLRYQQKPAANGPTAYSVRCIREGSRIVRDVMIACAATAGPERCRSSQVQQAFPRLDAAASSMCADQGAEVASR